MPFETQMSLASSPKAPPRFLHSQLSSASQHLPAGHRPFLDPSQTLPSEHGCVSVWVLLQSRWRGAEVPWHTEDRSGRRGCPCSPLAMLPHPTESQPAPHLVSWLLLPLPPGLTWVPHMGSRAHGAPTSYPGPIRGSQRLLLHSAGSALSEAGEVLKPIPLLTQMSSTPLRTCHAVHLAFFSSFLS